MRLQVLHEEYVRPRRHLQSTVHTPSGEQVPVDRRVLPLLTSLWNAGFKTHDSCQGNRNQKIKKYRYAGYVEIDEANPKAIELAKYLKKHSQGRVTFTTGPGVVVIEWPSVGWVRVVHQLVLQFLAQKPDQEILVTSNP